MNEKSSRSHAIFTVSLRQEKASENKTLRRPASSMSVKSNTSSSRRDEEFLITTSKFHFVDLAGSERVSKERRTRGKPFFFILFYSLPLKFTKLINLFLLAKTNSCPRRSTKGRNQY
jgi:hypothetical protein